MPVKVVFLKPPLRGGEVEDLPRLRHAVPPWVEVLVDDREGAHLLVGDLYALLVDGARRGGGDEVADEGRGGSLMCRACGSAIGTEPTDDYMTRADREDTFSERANHATDAGVKGGPA